MSTITRFTTERERRAGRWVALVVALCASLLLPSAASARKYFDSQNWRPSPHSQDLFQGEGVRINYGTLGIRQGRSGEETIVEHYWSGNAYVMYNMVGEPLDPAVDLLSTINLLGAVSYRGRVSLGLDLPLHVHRSGDGGVGGKLAGFTLGDLRTSLKVAILRPRKYGVGVGVALDLFAPTGGEDGFTEEEGVVVKPKILLEGVNQWVQAVLNISYLARVDDVTFGPLELKDELEILFGLGITLGMEGLQLILETDFSSRVDEFFREDTTRLEIDAGLRYRLPYGLAFQAGGGGGVLDGYGDPAWRFFASVGWMPVTYEPLPPEDSDGDGFKDPDDMCPYEAEDYDAYQDEDGCPELDNDADGVLDTADACPMDPEDKDGFEDEDGCPEPDNDGDGILDINDGCPLVAEDKDGFQDEDGCPEADNDGDGILDPDDQCPLEPEDFDKCQDEDGCPEPGNICVTEKKLVIADKIYFRTNKARIKPVSYPLLDEIASVVNSHPEILLIEIQGHTDSRGRDRYNLKLSEKRAKAVRDYLVKRGFVDPARLVSKGYGETMPIDTNETEEGRAANRRVEFMIIKRAPKEPPK